MQTVSSSRAPESGGSDARWPGLQRAALLVVLLLFALGAGLYIERPGLHFDEGDVGIVVARHVAAFQAGGPLVPPPLDDLEGSTLPGLLTLSFLALGPGYLALRLPFVLLSLLGLFAFYRVLRGWFGPAVALGGAALLALDATFVQASRVALCRQGVIHLAFFWIALALIQHGWQRQRRWPLLAAGLVLGLALGAKVMIVGFVLAALGGALLVYRGAFWRGLRRVGAPTLAGSVAAFALGSAHFWIDHLSRGAASFAWTTKNFGPGGPWNNWDLGRNLLVRLNDLGLLLTGRIFDFGQPNRTAFDLPNPFILALFLVCLGVLCRRLWRRQGPASWRGPVAWLLAFHGLLLLATLYVPREHSSGHVVVVATVGPTVLALVLVPWLVELARRTAEGQVRRAVALPAAICLLLGLGISARSVAVNLLEVRAGLLPKTYAPVRARVVAQRVAHSPLPHIYNLSNFKMFDVEFATAGAVVVDRLATRPLVEATHAPPGEPRPPLDPLLEQCGRTVLERLDAERASAYLLVQQGSPYWGEVWRRLRERLRGTHLRWSAVLPPHPGAPGGGLSLLRIDPTGD